MTLRQTQRDAPFLTPLPVKLVLQDGDQLLTLRPAGRTTVARFPITRKPAEVQLDPDETILKEARVTAQ